MDTLHQQLTPPKTKGRDGSLSDPSALRARGTSCPKPQATQSPSPSRIPHFAFAKSDLRSPGAQRPSAIRPPLSAIGDSAASAFTLIESVVAIGIFAFVIVGIVGLFGAALERQRQASFETRAVMISQQTLARIRAANSSNSISLTRGQSNDLRSFTNINLLTAPAVGFYQQDGTECSGISANDSDWTGANIPTAVSNVVAKSRTRLTPLGNGLFQVDIEVSEPANLPFTARRYTNTFTTLATFPN
jgi:type II secretory pathway pseudopilin PulG